MLAVCFSSQPADVLDNLALNSRVLLNRKRAHHSQEKGGERLQAEEGEKRDKKEAETGQTKRILSPHSGYKVSGIWCILVGTFFFKCERQFSLLSLLSRR